MKKIITVLLGIIMAGSLVSCNNNTTKSTEPKNKSEIKEDLKAQKPEDVITDFFTKFKNCNFSGIQNDILTEDSVSLKGMEDYSDSEKKAIKYWLEKLSYEIIKVDVNGDEAIAKVKVSALDGNQIYNKYKDNILKIKPNAQEELDEEGAKLADEKYGNALVNALKDKDNEIVSKTVDIKLNKKDGKWLLEFNNELLTAIYGGLDPDKVNFK